MSGAAQMQAVRVLAHGGLEALRYEPVPRPIPGPGEVLVRVRACAVNHLDLWVRKGVPGHKFPLPLITGNDAAGVVVEAPGTDLRPGAEVVVAPGVSCGHCTACASGRDHHCRRYAILGEHRDGGQAEYMVVPRANALPKPQNLGFAEAAAIGIPFLTAWHMLVARAELRVGETVLVHAGGSGVGSAAVQIARLLGATVIATASSAAKAERAAALGADHVIDTSREGIATRVKELTAGRGAEVVFEHVGAATWDDSLRSLARQGRLVTCGATTGAEVKVDLRHLFFKSQSLLGSTMGSRGELCQVLELAARGKLRPVVDHELPLSAVADAHRLLEERRVFGKVVLIPDAPP